MFLKDIVFEIAQQLICACMTAVGRLDIRRCTSVVLLMCEES